MDMRTGQILQNEEFEKLYPEAKRFFEPIEEVEFTKMQSMGLEERLEYQKKRKELLKFKKLVDSIDLDTELRLIKEKRSTLSATQRELILQYAEDLNS